jgi:hypothetical protein
VLVFTNIDTNIDNCKTINVSKHPDRKLLEFNKTEKLAWMKKRGLPKYDYFKLQYLPGNFVNKDQYDYIMFFDADVLFINPLDDVFEQENIATDFHNSNVFEKSRKLKEYLTEPGLAQTFPALSSAVIGVPRHHYKFYELFKAYYLKHLNESPHDEDIFNLCMFENRHQFKATPMLEDKYWHHYWGYDNKDIMFTDYKQSVS